MVEISSRRLPITCVIDAAETTISRLAAKKIKGDKNE
jgi:hypothetical protein